MLNEPTDAKLNSQWRLKKRLALVSLVILLLAAGTPYGVKQWQYYQTHESTDDAYVVGHIIPISTRVGGTVRSVYVENHQQVEVGQPLAQLDPQDLETQVQEAQAAVAMAEAGLSRAKMDAEWERQRIQSDIAHAQAAVQTARSDWQEDRRQVATAQAHLRTQQAVVTVAQGRCRVPKSPA